jgi:molybdopterin molybdotransferase
MKSLDEIAQALQGFDPQALRVDKAQEFIQHLVEALPPIATEELPLMQALGRIVAEDIISPINVPAHDNSAMDGFAFDGNPLGLAPLKLRMVGTARAGKAWQGTVKSGECVKIMTGAVMPTGLDTVIAQELAAIHISDDETIVEIPPGVLQAGDNRRKAGEDLQRGLPALREGSALNPAALGLVASLGIATIMVYRQLRVAYFSTGDEVLSLGEAMREGAVFDSNRYTVFGLLTRMGCQVVDMGVVRDDPVLLEQAFSKASENADVIITSGGVSVGEADFTKSMMKKLGDVAFWKIAMRPGRPMAVGRLGKCILFGLPGNPVAVMVTFLVFVKPALLQMMGSKSTPAPYLRAQSAVALRKKPGRTEYQRGFVHTLSDGTLQVQVAGNQGSGVLRSMVQANGLIVLHHHQAHISAGQEVDVMMFDGVIG